jgi:hypothetical protein
VGCEKVEDTKGEFRSRKSKAKKDHDQMKKDKRTNNDLQRPQNPGMN